MSNCRMVFLACALLLTAGVSSCDFGLGPVQEGLEGPEQELPSVQITHVEPSSREVVLGQEVRVGYYAQEGDDALAGVYLYDDGNRVARHAASVIAGEMVDEFSHSPTTVGQHTLDVVAYDTALDESAPASVTVVVVAPSPSPTITPTDTPTSTPTDTPTSTSTSTPISAPTSTPTRIPTSTPTRVGIPPTSCPTLRINAPSEAPAQLPFGVEWDVTGAPVPSGHGYALEFSRDQTSWQRASIMRQWEEGGYQRAEVPGPGGEGEFYWRVCLVAVDGTGPAQCCSEPHRINHTRPDRDGDGGG